MWAVLVAQLLHCLKQASNTRRIRIGWPCPKIVMDLASTIALKATLRHSRLGGTEPLLVLGMTGMYTSCSYTDMRGQIKA
eukprot:2068427-Pleurochrysis_carterae.AAC.3